MPGECEGGYVPLILSSIGGVPTIAELPEGECLCAPICGITGFSGGTGPTGPTGGQGTYGTAGTAGTNTTTVQVFQKNNSGTVAPTMPTGTVSAGNEFVLTFSTGGLTTNGDASLNSWTLAAPTLTAGEYLWVTEVYLASLLATASFYSDDWGTAVVRSIGGSDGTTGIAGTAGTTGATGIAGTAGTAGAVSMLVSMWQVEEVLASPPDAQDSDVVYTFATQGIATPDNGWAATAPAMSAGEVLYVTRALAYNAIGGATALIEGANTGSSDWTAAVIESRAGSDGITGTTGSDGTTGTTGTTGIAGTAGPNSVFESDTDGGWAGAAGSTNTTGKISLTGTLHNNQILAYRSGQFGGSGGWKPATFWGIGTVDLDAAQVVQHWESEDVNYTSTGGTLGTIDYVELRGGIKLRATGTSRVIANRIDYDGAETEVTALPLTAFAGAIDADTPSDAAWANINATFRAMQAATIVGGLIKSAGTAGSFKFRRDEGATYQNLISTTEGTITIQAEDDVHFMTDTDKKLLRLNETGDGECELYQGNTKRIETTSDGADIFGDLDITQSLNLSGAANGLNGAINIVTQNTIVDDGTVITTNPTQEVPHMHGDFIYQNFTTDTNTATSVLLGENLTTSADWGLVKSIKAGGLSTDTTYYEYTPYSLTDDPHWNVKFNGGIYKFNLNLVVANSAVNPTMTCELQINGVTVHTVVNNSYSVISPQSISMEWVGAVRSSFDVTVKASASTGNVTLKAGSTISITRIA